MKKLYYAGLTIFLFILMFALIIFFNTSKSPKHSPLEIGSCNYCSGASPTNCTSYISPSDNLIQNAFSVLCYNSLLYRCNDAVVSTFPKVFGNYFSSNATHGQRIGSWKCSEQLKKWVPSSYCVFQLNSTFKSHAANKSVGYFTDHFSIIQKNDSRFFCFNEEEYSCGWQKQPNSSVINLSHGGRVGNSSYKCFNNSGVSFFYEDNFSCIFYSSGTKEVLASLEGVGGLIEVSLDSLSRSVLDSSSYRQSWSRILCSEGSLFFCGEDSFNSNTMRTSQDGEIIRDTWRCKKDEGWEIIKPNIYLASTNCVCGGFCNLSFNNILLSSPFNFKINVNYKLFNSTLIKEEYTVNPTIIGDLAYGNFSLRLDCKKFNATMTSLSFEVKTNLSIDRDPYSRWGAVPIIRNCTEECNYVGQTECVDSMSERRCGFYNSSNSCLSWSQPINCLPGQICSSNRCTIGGRTNTCTPNSKICSTNLPEHAIVDERLQCPSSDQFCFSCEENYTWNGTTCVISSCRENEKIFNNSCVESCPEGTFLFERVCISSCPTGYFLFNNTCLNRCPEGYHSFNNATCVSNICGGTSPFNNESVVIKGRENYYTGIKNWTFVKTPIFGPLRECEWSCRSGFILNPLNNSECIPGKYSCEEINGICISPSNFSTGMINLSNYSYCEDNSFICIYCNLEEGYSLNGTSCVKMCPNSYYWNGTSCISIYNCTQNKCYLNGKCLPQGFRFNRTYCNGSVFVSQREVNSNCQNDYECITNYCGPQRRCIDLTGEISRNASLIKKVWCWISNGFNTKSEGYLNCISTT
ncbi:MAG: hypothetical protein QW273_00325 [Candidatus Pacearchaeota archaeon]